MIYIFVLGNLGLDYQMRKNYKVESLNCHILDLVVLMKFFYQNTQEYLETFSNAIGDIFNINETHSLLVRTVYCV